MENWPLIKSFLNVQRMPFLPIPFKISKLWPIHLNTKRKLKNSRYFTTFRVFGKTYAYSIKPVIGALSRAEGHCIAACCPVLLLYCRLTRCTVPGGFFCSCSVFKVPFPIWYSAGDFASTLYHWNDLIIPTCNVIFKYRIIYIVYSNSEYLILFYCNPDYSML